MTVRSIQRRYYLITFLTWFAVALPLSLSVLLAQARGMTLTQVGFALGLYSLTVVLLEVPTGGLADAAGRKRVALLAFALAAAYNVAFLFAFTFPAFLLAMVLYGVSRALSSGALDAWFVDALQAADPAVDLQPSLAGVETVSLLALGLGAVGGSALPRVFAFLPPDGTAVLTPLSTPLLAALVVKLVLLAAIALLVHEDRPAAGRSWRAGFTAVPGLVRDAAGLSRANPRLLLLMSTAFVAGFAIISLEALWQPFFAGLTAPGEPASTPTLLFGFIMAGNFIVGMGGNLLSVPLSRRLGGRHALVGALSRLLQGGFLLALAAMSGLPAAVACFWLVYLMGGVAISPTSTLVNREIPSDKRSAMLSVQSLAAYLGSFLGGTALGAVADHWSISAAWAIAGGLTLLSAIPYLLIERMNRRDEQGYEQRELSSAP